MSSIQITPLPNNLKFTSSVTTIGNGSIPTVDSNGNAVSNYQPNGTYKITSSSVIGSLTNANGMPFNVFNKTNMGYFWQSDISGGTKKQGGDSTTTMLYNYSAYSQNAYLSTNTNTGATSNLTAAYQGGGDTSNTFSTAISSKNISLPGEWIQIQLPYKVYLTQYELITPTSLTVNNKKITMTFPTKFTVAGSNDGENWEYVDQQNISTTSKSTDNTYKVTSSSNYSYFRLIISEMNAVMSCVAIAGLYLSGITILPSKSGFMTLSRAMEVSDIDYGNMNYMNSSKRSNSSYLNSLLPYNRFEGFGNKYGAFGKASTKSIKTTPVFNYVPGLTFIIYKGYHDENQNYASTATVDPEFISNTKTTTNISDLASGTSNLISQNQNRDNFSVQWSGYFYTGNLTGYWKFTTNSDDGSYLWINNTLVVNNGGGHGMTPKSETIYLNSTTYYPIKLLYGNGSGGYNIILSFTPPNGSGGTGTKETTDGTNYYFSLPVQQPLPSLSPIVDKIQTKQLTPLQQISSDYSKTFNNMIQGSVDLSGNIANITNSSGTGLRDKLMADPQYDYNGSLFNFGKNDVSVGDVRVQDTKELAEEGTNIYILGAITSVTLLIAAIYIAME
jgi:hypothetical protein